MELHGQAGGLAEGLADQRHAAADLLDEAERAGSGGEQGVAGEAGAAVLGELVERDREGEAARAPDLEAVVEDAQRDATAEAVVAVQEAVEQGLADGCLGVLAGGLGSALLWAVAMTLVFQVSLLGANLAYLRVSEGVDSLDDSSVNP